MRAGIVYSETVVHAPAERFAADAPFQVALIDITGGDRVTARISGERVAIGDAVTEIESPGHVPHFRKS